MSHFLRLRRLHEGEEREIAVSVDRILYMVPMAPGVDGCVLAFDTGCGAEIYRILEDYEDLCRTLNVRRLPGGSA